MPLREIARHVKVDDRTVRRHHEKVSAALPQIPKPAKRAVTRGCTQREIAEQLGVAHNTVGDWFTHLRNVPECVNAPALPSAGG